jgi:hypothetical protein
MAAGIRAKMGGIHLGEYLCSLTFALLTRHLGIFGRDSREAKDTAEAGLTRFYRNAASGTVPSAYLNASGKRGRQNRHNFEEPGSVLAPFPIPADDSFRVFVSPRSLAKLVTFFRQVLVLG